MWVTGRGAADGPRATRNEEELAVFPTKLAASVLHRTQSCAYDRRLLCVFPHIGRTRRHRLELANGVKLSRIEADDRCQEAG